MPEFVVNHVRTIRMEKGLTQEELAAKVGVSRQTIIAIERGSYTPSVLLALKISTVFKKSVEQIFRIAHE
jgi:putative transcriptional regulator